jgi:hypothetical protein
MVMVEDDTPSITLTILVGSGGGYVVYDVSNNLSRLAFGGNLDETTAYLHSIMDSLGHTQLKETTMLGRPLGDRFASDAIDAPRMGSEAIKTLRAAAARADVKTGYAPRILDEKEG